MLNEPEPPSFETGGIIRQVVTGTAAPETFGGYASAVEIDAGGGADTLAGSAENDILNGGDGDDSISTGGGSDLIDGGAGQDVLSLAGVATDYAWSRQSDGDVVVVGVGLGGVAVETRSVEQIRFLGNNTTVALSAMVAPFGTELADTLTGGAGDDDLHGLAGADTFIESGGDDVVRGGDGTDLAVFGAARGNYALAAEEGGVVTVSNLATGATTTLFDVETLSFAGGVSVTAQAIANGFGTAASDSIVGGDGGDRLAGGDGGDTLEGGGGSDQIDGGAGVDVARFAGDVADYAFYRQIDGSTLVEHLSSGAVDKLIAVEKVIFGGGAAQDLDAVAGDFGTSGADALEGGTRAENLFGLDGDDTIEAAGGGDYVEGGSGEDFLDGGAGYDTAGFFGSSTDFTFRRQADGSVLVTDLTGAEGQDRLVDVEAVYFEVDAAWFGISQVVGGGAGR